MTLAADHPDRMDPGRPPVSADAVHRALQNARDHLLGLQDPAGWWKGELETNVTMEAEDLLLRQFLGIRDEQVTRDRLTGRLRELREAEGDAVAYVRADKAIPYGEVMAVLGEVAAAGYTRISLLSQPKPEG